MLRPGKHAHPDRTVMAAATTALRALRGRRVLEYDELRKIVEKKTGSDVDFLFGPAITLLYLLGLLEYQPIVDAFEYRGR